MDFLTDDFRAVRQHRDDVFTDQFEVALLDDIEGGAQSGAPLGFSNLQHPQVKAVIAMTYAAGTDWWGGCLI